MSSYMSAWDSEKHCFKAKEHLLLQGERDYTDEALAHLNYLKPLKNLWRALMSALDKEFKHLKKPLQSVLNLNLLRAGQLQRSCSTVSNSSSWSLGQIDSTKIM